MLRQLYVFSLLIFTFASCNISKNSEEKNVKWDANLTVEENIANQVVAFQSDSLFPFLDDLAKTRSVIMLGESGHEDATTQEIKKDMVLYLAKKGGYSVAFEGYPFLTCYLLSNKEYSSLTKDWGIDAGPYKWTSLMYSGMRGYLNQNINVFGIDVYAGFYDIKAVYLMLDKYFKEYPVQIEWEKLERYYYLKFIAEPTKNSVPSLSISAQLELVDMINIISNYTLYIIDKEGKSIDLEAILQWVRIVNTNFSCNKIYETNIDISNNPTITTLPFRNRDSQMAENIIWLTDHFPKDRFTVWLANYHGVKDISQTIYPADSLMYSIHQCAAEGVYNKLRNKLYSLAFTSLNYKGKVVDPGAFELAIAKKTGDSPYAFVDFESLRFVDGFRDKEFEAAMIKKKKGRWLYMFDGVYYIRDQNVLN